MDRIDLPDWQVYQDLPAPNSLDHQRISNSRKPPLDVGPPISKRPQQLLQYAPPKRNGDPAMSIHAYYERYGGKGPMTVPGSEYNSKYGPVDEQEADDNNIAVNKNSEKLYEKYDSPVSISDEGVISDSNSVAGMALQDRPTGNSNPHIWEKFFKAGLYGSNLEHTQGTNQKVKSIIMG